MQDSEITWENLNSLHPIPEGAGYSLSNPMVIYCDGVFDMFHIGHSNVFKQVTSFFPHTRVVVGVSGHDETQIKKGKTILNGEERAAMVEQNRYVDKIIYPCPWNITAAFLVENGIHMVAHDDLPYSCGSEDESGDIYLPLKKAKRFLATKRTEGISTTDLVVRIVKDYDEYVFRNLQRGVPTSDLNISYPYSLKIYLGQYCRGGIETVKSKFEGMTYNVSDIGKYIMNGYRFFRFNIVKGITDKIFGPSYVKENLTYDNRIKFDRDEEMYDFIDNFNLNLLEKDSILKYIKTEKMFIVKQKDEYYLIEPYGCLQVIENSKNIILLENNELIMFQNPDKYSKSIVDIKKLLEKYCIREFSLVSDIEEINSEVVKESKLANGLKKLRLIKHYRLVISCANVRSNKNLTWRHHDDVNTEVLKRKRKQSQEYIQ